MADIIKLEERRQLQLSEKRELLREEMIELLRKIFQCARCQLKCSRCSTQIRETEVSQHSTLPYPFCLSCRDEYELYLKRSRGELIAERYWHNEEWMEVWRTWLHHQEVLDRYRNSKEFIKLLQELET